MLVGVLDHVRGEISICLMKSVDDQPDIIRNNNATTPLRAGKRMSLQSGYTVHSAVYIRVETRALITDGIGKYRRVPAFHEGLTRCKRISSVNYEYDFGMTMAPRRFIKCLLDLVDLPHLVLAPLIDFRTRVSSYTRAVS